jgi:hypothetical protein
MTGKGDSSTYVEMHIVLDESLAAKLCHTDW